MTFDEFKAKYEGKFAFTKRGYASSFFLILDIKKPNPDEWINANCQADITYVDCEMIKRKGTIYFNDFDSCFKVVDNI